MRIENVPLIRRLAKDQVALDLVKGSVGSPKGTARAIITDVNDPEERGRVRVIFDAMNPEKVGAVDQGAGEFSGPREGVGGNVSHWIDTCPAFKGKQPPGLVDKRVNVCLGDGEYYYAILTDVLYDPQNLVEEAARELEIPNNSSMSRLPVYPLGELPPPCAENLGCIAIEEGGPMDSDWLCVCLKRDGIHLWVRHSDLSHVHAGGNDGTQQVDSMGNAQNPVMIGTISDKVCPTSAKQCKTYSAYSSRPSGNPKGGRCQWYPCQGSEEVTDPGEDFDLLSPDPDISLETLRNLTSFPDLNFSVAGFSIPSPVPIPAILTEQAQSFLAKAQQVTALVEQAQSVVNNPLGFATDQALGLASSLLPQNSTGALSSVAQIVSGGNTLGAATEAVKQQALAAAAGALGPGNIPPGTLGGLSAISNPAGILPSSLAAVSIQPGTVFTALRSLL